MIVNDNPRIQVCRTEVRVGNPGREIVDGKGIFRSYEENGCSHKLAVLASYVAMSMHRNRISWTEVTALAKVVITLHNNFEGENINEANQVQYITKGAPRTPHSSSFSEAGVTSRNTMKRRCLNLWGPSVGTSIVALHSPDHASGQAQAVSTISSVS
jgi:hypothetical protein